MRVPAILPGREVLVREMDPQVFEQISDVATLPGIVEASSAMPDAHRGDGLPIGGVATFDLIFFNFDGSRRRRSARIAPRADPIHPFSET